MAKMRSGFTCLSEIKCVVTDVCDERQHKDKSSRLIITTQKSVLNLQVSFGRKVITAVKLVTVSCAHDRASKFGNLVFEYDRI